MEAGYERVFSGLLNKDAMWIESVQGLGAANDLMKELAAKRPGPYFVFDAISHKILAQTDTSQKKHETLVTNSVTPSQTEKSDIEEVA
jgi:hypothetical protein